MGLEAAVTAQPAKEGLPNEATNQGLADLLGDVICKGLLWLCAGLLAAAVVVVAVEVIYRYWLKVPFLSSSDLLSILFTWFTFLSIPRALWNGRSPRLGVLKVAAGSRLAAVVDSIQVGVTLAYFCVIVVSYMQLAPVQAATDITSLGVPETVEGYAVLVGASLMAILTLLRYRHLLRDRVHLPIIAVSALALVSVVRFVSNPVLGGLIVLLILFLLNVPIAVALGLSGFVMVIGGSWPQASVPAQQLLQPMQNLAFLALPLFLLMGGLVGATSLSENLSSLIRRALGWLPGGTAIANSLTAAVFANITGSAIADTAVVGEVYIPELSRIGYPKEEAAAVGAAAGVIGITFPPAVAMILYSTAAQVNVIPVFKAIIFPGVLMLFMIGVISYHRGRSLSVVRNGVEPFRFGALLRAIPPAIPVLLLPVILDGGILSGVFTPAESGAVAILVTVVLVFTVVKIKPGGLYRALESAVDNAATVMFIITAVSIIDYGFVVSGIGSDVASLLSHFTGDRLLMILIINLIFMVVHEFIDAGPALLVIVPLILGSVNAAHINLIQLGAILAINATTAAVLPPVGMGVYVAAGIAGVEASKVFRITWRYSLGALVVLLVVVLVPQVSLWLPRVL